MLPSRPEIPRSRLDVLPILPSRPEIPRSRLDVLPILPSRPEIPRSQLDVLRIHLSGVARGLAHVRTSFIRTPPRHPHIAAWRG